MDVLASTRTRAFAFFALVLCLVTVATIWISIPTSREQQHQQQEQEPPAIDSIATTVKEGYEVTGYSCDPLNHERVNIASMKQGDILTICVEIDEKAVNEGISLAGVESFTWFRDDVTSSILSQVAIEGGVASRDGDTSYHCDLGSTMCYFRSMLMSEYYMVPGELFGEGTVSLTYPSTLEPGDTSTTTTTAAAAANGDGVVRRLAKASFGIGPLKLQPDVGGGPPPLRNAGGVGLTTNARTIFWGSAVSSGLVVGASIVLGW